MSQGLCLLCSSSLISLFVINYPKLFSAPDCYFGSKLWVVTLGLHRTNGWHASFLGPVPWQRDFSTVPKRRTWAWESLLGEQTKAQSTAGMECPNGRCINPTSLDAECKPFYCGSRSLPVLWLLIGPANIYVRFEALPRVTKSAVRTFQQQWSCTMTAACMQIGDPTRKELV